MVFLLHPDFTEATPEQDFWKWFQENETQLFDFKRDDEGILNSLTLTIHHVDPGLTFEFGPNIDNHREFVISADGIRETFPKVIALYDAAPKLPRWTFIKFRPRREPMDIRYGGISVRAKEILFTAHADGRKVGITLFIPGHTGRNHETMMGIAFLMLDQALGEFDVATDVGVIDVTSSAKAPSEAKAFKELPKMFNEIISLTGKRA